MDIIVADAGAACVEAIETLEKRCFSEPWTQAMIAGQLTDENHVLLAAERNGELIGYAGLMTVLDEGYISNVAVKPEYRRKGVGRRLMEELESRARERNLSFLTLEVRQSNSPAIELYDQCGFQVVGVRKNYYEKPREDAVLMTKTF